jgi:hypothetical protein
MATVTIPDSTYAGLQKLATAMRLPLDQYLARIAAGEIEPPDDTRRLMPGTSEWSKVFDSWVSSHPALPFIADDSRDVIYADERD